MYNANEKNFLEIEELLENMQRMTIHLLLQNTRHSPFYLFFGRALSLGLCWRRPWRRVRPASSFFFIFIYFLLFFFCLNITFVFVLD
jgi:hypothetical protein